MGNIKIGRMVLSMCQTNCYFLYREDTKNCILIDPADQGTQIYNALTRNGFTIQAILLTHGHFDHAGGAEDLAKEFDIKIYAHEAEKDTLRDAQKNVSWMAGKSEVYDADIFLKDEELITLAGFEIKVLHTPGHTEGGCCYYISDEGVVFSGDTLFAQSVGRTDFPGGSMSQIVRSIQEKLLRLNEPGNLETDIMVYPGHNDPTTIETERMHNPYL